MPLTRRCASPLSQKGEGCFPLIRSPLPRGEGGPLPALSSAGAGRVRGTDSNPGLTPWATLFRPFGTIGTEISMASKYKGLIERSTCGNSMPPSAAVNARRCGRPMPTQHCTSLKSTTSHFSRQLPHTMLIHSLLSPFQPFNAYRRPALLVEIHRCWCISARGGVKNGTPASHLNGSDREIGELGQ